MQKKGPLSFMPLNWRSKKTSLRPLSTRYLQEAAAPFRSWKTNSKSNVTLPEGPPRTSSGAFMITSRKLASSILENLLRTPTLRDSRRTSLGAQARCENLLNTSREPSETHFLDLREPSIDCQTAKIYSSEAKNSHFSNLPGGFWRLPVRGRWG